LKDICIRNKNNIKHEKTINRYINILKNLTPYDIQSLTKINEKIGFQSYAYFQDFNFQDKGVCGQNL